MAKVTISFVSNDDSKLTIESDQERNKDYTGSVKSKFRYGDTAYFRVYTDSIRGVTAVSTDGDITEYGSFYEVVADEPLPFVSEQTAETEKPIAGIIDGEWLGSDLGALTHTGPSTIMCEALPTADKIGLASITYRTVYKLFGLTLPERSSDEYPVMVYVRIADV